MKQGNGVVHVVHPPPPSPNHPAGVAASRGGQSSTTSNSVRLEFSFVMAGNNEYSAPWVVFTVFR